MEETACAEFLNQLSRMVARRDPHIPEQLELPALVSLGFGKDAEESDGNRSEYLAAQFRDGLALLERLPPERGVRVWRPGDGLGEA